MSAFAAAHSSAVFRFWPLVLSLAVPPSAVFGYRVDNTLEHIEE
jgi:hypothetical protein